VNGGRIAAIRRMLEHNHVMPKRKTDAPADPDKLLRQEAGTYHTADGRFEARETAGEWFLVDTEQSNEFGQELIRGPFATLKALRAAIPEARDSKVAPMKPRPAAKAKATSEPPKRPPSWIDALPRTESARVRLLIRALEGEGIQHAEALVRRDREGLFPTVAAALIQRRLDALVEDLPEKARKPARELVRRAAEVLSDAGTGLPEPLPGWSLVELGPEPEPSNRRIVLGE
jgi:hypothetical protein